MEMISLFSVASQAGTYGIDLVEVLTHASPMVAAVLWFLVAMSVVCWFIIGYKWFYLKRASRANRQFLEIFWSPRRLDQIAEATEHISDSPAARVFRAAYTELVHWQKLRGRTPDGAGDEEGDSSAALDRIRRAIRNSTVDEVTRLEKMVSILGTTGATAPFIGLFGTVWGIVEAFDLIPKDSGGMILDKVAAPMAHALIATAVGLLAAIPAVMAYNYFVRRIRLSTAEVEAFSADFVELVKRHYS